MATSCYTLTMRKKSLFFNRATLPLLISLIALLIIVNYLLHVWPTAAETLQALCAAVIGVGITSLITCVLLRYQSQNDGERERDAKIYEHKLIIFQEFLNDISNIVEDGKITTEEANTLKFTFSKIALHLKDEHLAIISSHLARITNNCGATGPEQSNKPVEITEELMGIVDILRGELYSNKSHSGENETFRNDIFVYLKELDNMVEKNTLS